MSETPQTFSIYDLSNRLGVNRETVTKYLKSYDHDEGSGKRKRYSLKTACIALSPYFIKYSRERESSRDVEDLSPVEKKHHFEAKLKERQLQEEEGLLVRTSEVRETFASALKGLSLGLDIIPDRIELQCGLAPDQIVAMQSIIREMKDNLHRELEKDLVE